MPSAPAGEAGGARLARFVPRRGTRAYGRVLFVSLLLAGAALSPISLGQSSMQSSARGHEQSAAERDPSARVVPSPVRVGEAVAFTLAAEARGKSAKERAERASTAIAGVLELPEPGEVH